MVKVYIADAIGSIIAEKTADCMEIALDEYIHDRGGGIRIVSVPDIAAGMCRSKRNYFPYFLQRNLVASG